MKIGIIGFLIVVVVLQYHNNRKLHIEYSRAGEILALYQKTYQLRKEVTEDLSFRFERCLSRERGLQDLWQRKMDNYDRAVKLNRERYLRWRKKGKQSIRQAFYLPSSSWGTFEKPTIPYRWGYPTYWDVIAENSSD